jgi:hypothetical protein
MGRFAVRDASWGILESRGAFPPSLPNTEFSENPTQNVVGAHDADEVLQSDGRGPEMSGGELGGDSIA